MKREAWDERYAATDSLWSVEPNRFLVPETEALEPGRALDLACGEGRNALWLADRGWRVTAVDFSRVALERARSLGKDRGVAVDWIEADAVEWEPPARQFDLVLLLYLHLPPAERPRVLQGAAEAVADAGTLLVVGHDLTNLTDGYGGPKDASVLLTPEMVAAELPGLKVERAQRVLRDVHTPDGERTAIDMLVRAARVSSNATR